MYVKDKQMCKNYKTVTQNKLHFTLLQVFKF